MRRLLALVLAAPLVCAAPSASLPTAGAILGTYACVTHDSNHRTWRFESANTAWGAWVRADTTFAPQNGSPADRGMTLIGFDASTKRWSWVSLDADGSYNTRFSTSTHFNGSQWSDDHPSDRGTAIITIVNAEHYFVTFAQPETHGDIARDRADCTRS